MFHSVKSSATGFFVLCFFIACTKQGADVSPTDPLPLPAEIEANKDLSVNPGDSFFDYCNGTWLKNTPIPPIGTVGGMYDCETAMEERVGQLKASVPDIGRFYELMANMHAQPEKSQACLDALKAQFPKPATKEEAYLTMGKMLAEGITPGTGRLAANWRLTWTGENIKGLLVPPIEIPQQTTSVNPEDYIPIAQTKSGEVNAAYALIVKGMGLDPSLFVTTAAVEPYWGVFQNMSLEALCRQLDAAWSSYEMYVSQELMEKAGKTSEDVQMDARGTLNYTLSYHLASKFISPAFKEKLLNVTRGVQASLRKRIQKVDWMSETSRNNALDKLDNYHLFVAYPDEWHTDCVSTFSDCETLVEAVHRNNRNTARLKGRLLGGKDLFSSLIIRNMANSDNKPIPADLSLANAMYDPGNNSVYIYPALMMPPMMPENVSDAYYYAIFTIIGHEFTHGFDTQGAQYDKYGNKRNWWTVADQMAFEERRKTIIQCYNHLELDPDRAPGVYGDGERTQTENIADLGGFLAVLDAYKEQLEKDGYFGKVYDDQLRKFYECYSHVWCVQYGAEKFNILQKSDIHSHARLRVNGVVMNTDLWYQLYGVNRNNYLYLPQERRTYIW